MLAFALAFWATPAPAGPVDIGALYAGDLGLGPRITIASDEPQDDGTIPALRGSLAGEITLAGLGDDELHAMRGGFNVGGGVVVHFGFDITTVVNGVPVQRLSMTDGRTVTMTGPATAEGVDAQVTLDGVRLPASAYAILNAGSTEVMTRLDAGSMAQLLRNTADGQAISRHAVFDITVTGLNADLARKAQHQVLMNALSTRAILGR